MPYMYSTRGSEASQLPVYFSRYTKHIKEPNVETYCLEMASSPQLIVILRGTVMLGIQLSSAKQCSVISSFITYNFQGWR